MQVLGAAIDVWVPVDHNAHDGGARPCEAADKDHRVNCGDMAHGLRVVNIVNRSVGVVIEKSPARIVDLRDGRANQVKNGDREVRENKSE